MSNITASNYSILFTLLAWVRDFSIFFKEKFPSIMTFLSSLGKSIHISSFNKFFPEGPRKFQTGHDQVRLFPDALGKEFIFLASKKFSQKDQENFKLDMTKLDFSQMPWEKYFYFWLQRTFSQMPWEKNLYFLLQQIFPRRTKKISNWTWSS